MSKKIVIIKLGGSVVTDKDSESPKAREDVITQFSKELSHCLADNPIDLILVHGAGSFAHPIVKKSGIHKGMFTEGQKLAFTQANLNMLSLSNLISQSLINQNIPCTSLSPHSFITRTNNEIHINTKLIKEFLRQGIVPILFGDMILDDKQNSSVLSGDTIVSKLAVDLNADKVIFLSDVDGVFDSDPKQNSDAQLFSEINNQNLEQVLEGITENNPHDVTGEMKGKILEIKKELKGVEVILSNGLVSQNVTKALGQSPVGTRLQFE